MFAGNIREEKTACSLHRLWMRCDVGWFVKVKYSSWYPASIRIFEGRFWCGFYSPVELDWKVSLPVWDWNRGHPDPQSNALTSAPPRHANSDVIMWRWLSCDGGCDVTLDAMWWCMNEMWRWVRCDGGWNVTVHGCDVKIDIGVLMVDVRL